MLQHETWPIDKLIEYARNPRKNDHAVDRVAAAIREFGFRVPVVAKSDGTVVDGHLRLKAAKKLGLTEVPVALAEEALDKTTKSGWLILDLFGGSGSTLIACEKTGRHARLMELDGRYVDVIVRRWAEFTGKDPILESSGQTWSELSNVSNKG